MAGWILKSQEEQPTVFRLMPGAIKTVGRATRADFILDAPLVSRVHCRLSVMSDELVVEDLNSTNGTQVNGKLIKRHTLKPGDCLTVGKVAFDVATS